MKVLLVQYDPAWENKVQSRKRILKLLDRSKDSDAIIFPEMTLTGFTMNSREFSEDVSGESVEFFRGIALDMNTNVIAGFIEKKDDRLYNTLLHIDRKGSIAAEYNKIHPFSYSGEDKNYQAGDQPVITELDGIRTGLSICYDLRFPELFRQYAKQRAELIINIANWPVQRIEHWKALTRARAIENQCYFIGVNRVGSDPTGNKYNGQSVLFSPLGEDLIPFSKDETVLSSTIMREEVEKVRQRMPFLNDMKLL